MKANLLIHTLLLFIVVELSAQSRIIRTGSVPGYLTLKCDFHMHTIFSDGEVWPLVRVDEAVQEGLDVIAITDHIEYQPHREQVSVDHNAAWDLAFEYACRKNILLIHGTEITRKMPPGHFNALFLTDASALTDTSFLEVIRTAVEQGAIIFYNHPGWKGQQPDGVPRLYEVHRQLIRLGWLHGFEIYNYDEFYPDVMQWALDNNLTMFCNSDIHSPVETEYPSRKGKHRPLTLVFASEKNEPSLREALLAHRTLSWFQDTLAGIRELAAPFFTSSIKLEGPYYQDEKYRYFVLKNLTDMPFYLVRKGTGDAPEKINLPENSYVNLKIGKDSGDTVHYQVTNIRVEPDQFLDYEMIFR